MFLVGWLVFFKWEGKQHVEGAVSVASTIFVMEEELCQSIKFCSIY